MNISDNRRIIYQAIFINQDDVSKLIERQGQKLPTEVKDMHCTFKFQPSETEIRDFSRLLGKDLTLKVVGYCSDGKNSGYEVELSPDQERVYTNSHSVDNGKGIPRVEKTTPHITVSMNNGKAVDTGFLPFSREDFQPFFIHGKAGFFTSKFKNKQRTTEIIYDPILKDDNSQIIPAEQSK